MSSRRSRRAVIRRWTRRSIRRSPSRIISAPGIRLLTNEGAPTIKRGDASAASGRAMTSRFDPIVLIHGAWQGSWVWNRMRPFLDAPGLDSIAIDLPGNGAAPDPPFPVTLETYVAEVGRVIERSGSP